MFASSLYDSPNISSSSLQSQYLGLSTIQPDIAAILYSAQHLSEISTSQPDSLDEQSESDCKPITGPKLITEPAVNACET